MIDVSWLVGSGRGRWGASLLRGTVMKRKALARVDRFASLESLEERLLLTASSDGSIASSVEIATNGAGQPVAALGDLFGGSVSSIGDFDHDGVPDLVVGSPLNDTGGNDRGAVQLVFLNADGSVKSSTLIASSVHGGPMLRDGAKFGSSVAAVGDLNGDGVTDLAVGAEGDDVDSLQKGAVYILLMNANGTVQASTRIASNTNGGPKLATLNHFGHAVAAIGDLDQDGIEDLAVGAPDGKDGAQEAGEVYILFLNANGSVRKSTKIAGATYQNMSDNQNSFGSSLAAAGDINGDGIVDLAIGSPRAASGQGLMTLLTLSRQGKTAFAGNFGKNDFFASDRNFGLSMAAIGDLDGNGLTEFAVGAKGGQFETDGAIYIVSFGLSARGNHKTFRISDNLHGGPTLHEGDYFGLSVAAVGDLNGDGISELAVGSMDDNSNHALNGAMRILFPAVTDQLPSLALNNGPITYAGVNEPVSIAPNLTFSDPDTDPALMIPGGRLFIKFDMASNKKRTQLYDSVHIEGLTGHATPEYQFFEDDKYVVIIKFSQTATVAQIEESLRTLTFSTTKAGLKQPTRTFTFRIQDQFGGSSPTVTQTVNVRAS